MDRMNRKLSRYCRSISGRTSLFAGLLLVFISATGTETFSGYGSGSADDYGEACKLAGEDRDWCSGTLMLDRCNCKKEEPEGDYYWSCSVKWTCTVPSESDTESTDGGKKQNIGES